MEEAAREGGRCWSVNCKSSLLSYADGEVEAKEEAEAKVGLEM
jgi:hypothetical protein